MQLAKKTVLTNNAMTRLGTSKRLLEDAIIDLHRNDNDNWAIGDIKATARSINDANWHKCDGGYMLANVSEDIKTTLIRQHQVKIQKVALLDTTQTSYRNYYSDDTYVIIHSVYMSTSSSWDKLFIYTRDANGNIIANSQKTLRSYTNRYNDVFCGPIIKCGNYYYTISQFDDEDSGGLNARYWILYYTTNPAGSWASRTIWSGGNSFGYLFGFYTNDSQVRLELGSSSSGSSSNPREVTVYTFSGDGSNITSSTYSLTSDPGNGRSDEYNVYPVGDGKYARMQSSWYKWYKSSFTANWTQYTTPSWASYVYGIYYINGKYYGLFSEKNVDNSYIFAVANSYTAFSSTALDNLQYYRFNSYTDLYRHYGRTNAGIWTLIDERITVDSTTTFNTYFVILTENGMKRKLLHSGSDRFLNNYGKMFPKQNSHTVIAHATGSSLQNYFYFIGMSYPDMTNEPYDAYMKIATN